MTSASEMRSRMSMATGYSKVSAAGSRFTMCTVLQAPEEKNRERDKEDERANE